MKRKSYIEIIEETPLINRIEATITSGDVDYPGTALEVCDNNSKEHLFHVVVDSAGEIQMLFFAHKYHYRLSLSQMQTIIDKAKEVIRFIDENES